MKRAFAYLGVVILTLGVASLLVDLVREGDVISAAFATVTGMLWIGWFYTIILGFTNLPAVAVSRFVSYRLRGGATQVRGMFITAITWAAWWSIVSALQQFVGALTESLPSSVLVSRSSGFPASPLELPVVMGLAGALFAAALPGATKEPPGRTLVSLAVAALLVSVTTAIAAALNA